MIDRRLRALLLALLALEAHGAPWSELSDDCLAGLRRAEETPPSLHAACPEVSEALHADGWHELLTAPPEELPPWSITDLSAMAEHYRQANPGARVNVGSLDAALAALPKAAAEKESPSLWERFWEWLLGSIGGDENDLPEWLTDLALSDEAVRGVWYATVFVIALLAAAIVVNEIRLRSRRRADATASATAGAGGGEPQAAGSTAGETPREQLTALLHSIVCHLEALGALPRRSSLTHRELAGAAGLPEPARQTVAQVSHAAERVVYGSWSPDPGEVAPALTAGRRLLHDLEEPSQ